MRNSNYNAMRRYKPAAGSVPPLTRKGEATRQRILDAAVEEIGEHGFHLASVSNITSKAGVGQGTFYLYFKTKDDLLTELVGKLGREIRQLLTQSSQAAASRLGAERNALQEFLSYVYNNKALYRLFMESQFINPSLYQRCYEEFADYWLQLLNQAEEQGEVVSGDNDVRAWAIMGMHHMLATRYALWSAEAPNEDMLDEAVALLRDGIAPKSANQ